jgi:DNA processing protein
VVAPSGPIGLTGPEASGLPPEAHVVALARLPRVGPGRLRALLDRYGPAPAWAAVREGSVDPAVVAHPGPDRAESIVQAWARAARSLDVEAYWQRHLDAGVGIAVRGSAAFPSALADDGDPPSVVFWQGDLDHLAGARVAIVGTRKATRYGRDVAEGLGRGLAEAGVAVVSGLALGIDGAAHAGALAADAAPPIAVVGSGLDHVYPRQHAPLWRRVAQAGVVLSEYPLGAPAAAWQFPARNRLIAALADVVVVVESQTTGGAMGTALEAARRGVPVLSVPGPVTAASSDGTNQLLFDGCSPARDVTDVLLALGHQPQSTRRATERRVRPSGDAATVLDQVPWGPVPFEQLVLASGLDLGRVALALEQLEATGWVSRRSGWVERIGREP